MTFVNWFIFGWLVFLIWFEENSRATVERNLPLINSRDFRSLDTQPGHQATLVKGECVDAAMHGVGGEAAGHSFVHDDDARAGPDLPAARVIYPIHRLLIHEKECVTEFLSTGLQAIGGGYRPVAPRRFSMNEQDASPPCAPKINPALTTFGKTSTASARDDTLAAAEFCDLSWLRAARDSLVKLPNAVPDVSNTASINVARYFNVDLMVMLVLFGGHFLYFGFATWHKFQLQVPLSVWRSDRAKSN